MKLYGIKNCDTVKKARKWLESQSLDYTFIDLKVVELEATQLESWLEQGQGAPLINTRGTTFRKLSDEDKTTLTQESINVALLIKQPTLLKRPVLVTEDTVEIGFKAERYQSLFS